MTQALKEKHCTICGAPMESGRLQIEVVECFVCKGKTWKDVWVCPQCYIPLDGGFCGSCKTEWTVESE